LGAQGLSPTRRRRGGFRAVTAARDSHALSFAETHKVASAALAPVGVRAEKEQQAPSEAYVVVAGGPESKLGSHASGTARLRKSGETPGPVHEALAAVPATQRPDPGQPCDLLRRAAQMGVTQVSAATGWTLSNCPILSVANTLVRGHIQWATTLRPGSPGRTSSHTPRKPRKRAGAHPLSAAPGYLRSPARTIGFESWM
jgi:hypothetical protein